MMRRLLGKVDDGRFGRALAGLQAGWQWDCKERNAVQVEGFVRHGSKEYMVVIVRGPRLHGAVRLRGCSQARGAVQACGVCSYVGAGAGSGGAQCTQAAAGAGALMRPFFWSRRCPAPRAPGRNCAPDAVANCWTAAQLPAHTGMLSPGTPQPGPLISRATRILARAVVCLAGR